MSSAQLSRFSTAGSGNRYLISASLPTAHFASDRAARAIGPAPGSPQSARLKTVASTSSRSDGVRAGERTRVDFVPRRFSSYEQGGYGSRLTVSFCILHQTGYTVYRAVMSLSVQR